MTRTRDTRDTDNRDLSDMNRFLEARVEALTKRIRELEQENQELKQAIAE
jgi:chaperonin cofactor prefoldin